MDQLEINNELKFSHDLLDGVSNAWRDKIEQIMGLLPEDMLGMTVLDVGCGEGYFTVLCTKRGARVTALDIDPEAISCTDRLLKRYGLDSSVVEYVVKDAECFAMLNTTKYDYVLCLDLLEHSDHPQDLLKCLIGEADRLIVCLPNGLYFSHLLTEPAGGMGHRWFFTSKSASVLIESTGGEVRTHHDLLSSPHLIYSVVESRAGVVRMDWPSSGVNICLGLLNHLFCLVVQPIKWFVHDKRRSGLTFDDLIQESQSHKGELQKTIRQTQIGSATEE